MPAAMEAMFAPLGRGELTQRLCLWHLPTAPSPRRLFVHVHGFAEELNKSRRMASLQARALAEGGDAVLRFDLLGCGDSEGEFGAATWQDWVADTVAACNWSLREWERRWPHAPAPECWLWGHRAGALLAQAAAQALTGPWNLLLWQPTPAGKTVLQQFLRLDSAAAKLAEAATGAKSSDKGSAKARLAAGAAVEVAGYTITPALAAGLESAQLAPPAAAHRLVWLDLSSQANAQPSPVTQATLQAWVNAGWRVDHRMVLGPMFWQTTEIEDAPALVSATCEAVSS